MLVQITSGLCKIHTQTGPCESADMEKKSHSSHMESFLLELVKEKSRSSWGQTGNIQTDQAQESRDTLVGI